MKNGDLIKLMYNASHAIWRLSLNQTQACGETFTAMKDVAVGDVVFELSSFMRESNYKIAIGHLISVEDDGRVFNIRSLFSGTAVRWENAMFARLPPEVQYEPIYEIMHQHGHGEKEESTGLFFEKHETAWGRRAELNAKRSDFADNHYVKRVYLRVQERNEKLAKETP